MRLIFDILNNLIPFIIILFIAMAFSRKSQSNPEEYVIPKKLRMMSVWSVSLFLSVWLFIELLFKIATMGK